MKVTMVNAEWLPVPPVLGGPIEQTLFESALGIHDPQMTVISPWHPSLKSFGDGSPKIFHHVDVHTESARIRKALGGQIDVEKYFPYLNGVTELLLSIDPDVIQVHSRPRFVPYFLKQFPHKQVVLFMHGEEKYLGDEEIPLNGIIQDVSGFIFVSRYLAKRFIARYPASRSKVHVIHNAVDTETYHPDRRDDALTAEFREQYGLSPGRTILFVGRTVREKGLHCLLEAMKFVRSRVPDAKLLIAGSPFFEEVATSPYLDGLKRRALQLGDAVTFAGYVSHGMTPYLYGIADITAVPSIWEEPFGKVVVESMSSGVPVVASRRGGIPEIVTSGIDGILVDNQGGSTGLGSAIVSLLLEAKMRKGMGTLGRKKVLSKFSTHFRFQKLKKFYRSLATESRTLS